MIVLKNSEMVQRTDLKFSDGDGPNFCKIKKEDVSYTFIENIFRSGLTLVSSNDNNHQNRLKTNF